MKAHKYRYLILLVLLLFGLAGEDTLLSAQTRQRQIDSLESVLSDTKNKEQKVDILNRLSVIYSDTDIEKGVGYAGEALSLAQDIFYQKGEGFAYKNLGDIYLSYENRNIALQNFHKAMETFGHLENYENNDAFLDVLQNIGTIYSFFGDYNKALTYDLMALDGHIANQNFNKIGDMNNNIGTIYADRNEYEKALEYFNKAEQIKIKNGQENDKTHADVLSNMGTMYYAQKKLEEAELYYIKALNVTKNLNLPEKTAIYLNNLSNVYIDQGNYSKAEETLLQALKKANSIAGNKDYYLSSVYGDLGFLYLQRYKEENKEFLIDRAIDYLEKGVHLFLNIRHLNFYQEYSLYLSEAYKLKGDYKKSLEAFQEHSRYKDSLFNEEKTKEFTRKEMDYEYAKKEDSLRLVSEKEIALRDADIKARESQRWFFISVILLLGIIGGLLFYQNRLRQKRNHELDEANQIKTRFFSILGHDLRVPVSQLLNFLQLKKKYPGLLSEEEEAVLEDQTLLSTQNLLASMDDLLLWSKGQMENFKPQPKDVSVSSLFESISNYFSGTENITFHFENPGNLVLHTDEDYLKTVLRNLTSNAIKALANQENGEITWKAWHENLPDGKAGGKIHLSITDNGPGGTPEQFRALYDDKKSVGTKTGLGLHLVRDLAKAIDCKVTVETKEKEGTVVILSLAS